jgi:hypothetical protein
VPRDRRVAARESTETKRRIQLSQHSQAGSASTRLGVEGWNVPTEESGMARIPAANMAFAKPTDWTTDCLVQISCLLIGWNVTMEELRSGRDVFGGR